MQLKNIWNFIRDYIRPYYKNIIYMLILLLIFIPLSIVGPWISKIIIDDGLMTGDFDFMVKITVVLLLLKILESVVGFYVQYQFNLINLNFVKDVRGNLFQNSLMFNVNSFLNFGKGNIISRLISDIQLVSSTFSVVVFSLVFQITQIIIIAIILIKINFNLAIALYLFIPIYVVLIRVFNPMIIEFTKKERLKFDKISTALHEAFNGVKEIKSLGISNNIASLFNDHLRNHFNISRKRMIITYLASNILSLISGLPYIIILFFGSLLVFEKDLTIGELLAYLQYTAMIFNPIKQLVELNFNFQKTIPSIERLSELKDEKYFDKYNSSESNLNYVVNIQNPKIEFRNVTFSYDLKLPLLQDISFEIEKNQPVALVGRSGVGKSTILQLLLRWIEPINGEILLDNKNINRFSEKTLKKEISVVLQESFWFNTSIKKNFEIIKSDITDNEIFELLEKVNALEFVSSKEKSLDFLIGENGSNLSLGEKQRLSIARALIYDPKILIFDEITSSVDGVSEKHIIDLIENLRKDKLILFISHRASSINYFQKVIFLKNGKINAIGSHKDLIMNNSIYKENFNILDD